MSYSVYVRRAAERDISVAQAWYEQQQEGLAVEFHAEFTAAIDILTETPLIYPKLYRDIRRAVLHRFPYLVWYRVDNSTVTILACTHGKIGQTKIRRCIR